jgi:hypothetical protein
MTASINIQCIPTPQMFVKRGQGNSNQPNLPEGILDDPDGRPLEDEDGTPLINDP